MKRWTRNLLIGTGVYGVYSIFATAVIRNQSFVEKRFSGKGIALTFDDGPHPVYTPQLLDLLKRYDIRATFFVVGSKVEKYPYIIKRIHEEGHAIGIHHYEHKSNWVLTPRQLQKQLEKTAAAISHCTGKRPILYRPPWGHFNATTPFIARNYRMVLWSHIFGDWKVERAKMLYNDLHNAAEDGAVFLLHDCGKTLGADEEAPKYMLECLARFLADCEKINVPFVQLEGLYNG
ncbi:polysaccharide deacetylase family protein [Lysinibacillus odysseyi]|uniref:Polysaccharide deacetylase n=1 Tax=Lysinibacillus odysseyi 34hs-1 = NBRC 100172 TaxID=1220589 RepID=A0A0A3IU89_9BACI|nr:polysaccharide deacetylase family protein [Lysinibacillus odysseyi]KGR87025.1 polysaccharide deacetylase [Lysinibacillus odysseyi 34hs-1 = NBRC 100172]